MTHVRLERTAQRARREGHAAFKAGALARRASRKRFSVPGRCVVFYEQSSLLSFAFEFARTEGEKNLDDIFSRQHS